MRRQTLTKIIFRAMSSSSVPIKKTVEQPEWLKPVTINAAEKPVLKLYNSLTRSKNEFIPNKTNHITWYSCGPTVYDSSHMGHARNYVTIDINRRILQDYFGYNIKFVQNVTDIDDKIIIRARHNYLFDQFRSENAETISSQVIEFTNQALNEYISNNLPEAAQNDFESWASTTDLSQDPKWPMHVKAARDASQGLASVATLSTAQFHEKIKDVVVLRLDREKGSQVTDPEVFRDLPAFWEAKFDEDMAKLNVLSPTITTRVSEYVPDIVSFVEKIIANSFAYSTSDGSVYFDTFRFENSSKHDYAKLQPWNKNDAALIADGEGSLSNQEDGKRNAADFALWKASKPGEPAWDSPWGPGRPGWHIECSVMASDITGECMDIHSGGVDLCFPHHDNELAQSEAYFDNKQWVNYFLHSGHLHIQGQKMSKSLKNFITIEEALKTYSARQLRLVFASNQWNSPLDFKDSLINEVKSFERSLNNFFTNIRALNGESKNGHRSKRISQVEKTLLDDLAVAQDNVHGAFCDNLATPVVLKTISDLVIKSNTYISSVGSELRIQPLIQITVWITKILNVLGFESRADKLGWNDVSETSNSGASVEDIALPYVQVLSSFRDFVRSSAQSGAVSAVYLEKTDSLRDSDLLQLGVVLDDRKDQASLVKFVSESEKTELLRQQAEKERVKKEKEEKKRQAQLVKEKQENERRQKAQLKPEDLFRNELYSEWDEAGVPIKDKEGVEVTKSARKKFVKAIEQQKKLYDEYH